MVLIALVTTHVGFFWAPQQNRLTTNGTPIIQVWRKGR